jgi:hypothetical protein
MHPDYTNRIETAMTRFVNEKAPNGMLCHEGVAEVNVADNMPLGGPRNAVVVCSCGAPRASLEGIGDEDWKYLLLV